jgi:hypothetical protein
MPFSAIGYPPLGMALISSILKAGGLPAKVFYLNFDFAGKVGIRNYEAVTSGKLIPAYLMEWLFAGELWGGNGDAGDELFKIAEADGDTVDVAKVKSVKVAEFTTVTFYENPDGPGKSKSFAKDASALDLDFTTRYVAVESHVKAYKGGSVAAELLKGEYEMPEITKFDKVSVPRGFYLIFAGNENDANSVHIFENEEYALDNRIKGYTKVILSPFENADVRLYFKPGEELSDDDLLAVAGGACGKNACGGKACGADAPCAGNII